MIERGELVRQARARGVRLTRERLTTWQRAGLIGQAKIVYGEGRGRRSYYPADTLDRVVIIDDALAQRRDLDAALLALWRAGYPVSARPVFEEAIQTIREFQAQVLRDRNAVRLFVESDSPEMTDTYQTIEELPENWHKLPVLRAVHNSLKGQGVDYGQLVFLATVAHEPDGYHEPEDLEDRADILSAVAGLADLPLDQQPGAVLAAVRPHMLADNLDELLSGMTDEDLRRADRALRVVVGVVNALHATRQFIQREPVEPLIDLAEYPPKLSAWMALVLHSMLRNAPFQRF